MTSAKPPAERSELGPFEALGRIARIFYAPRELAQEIRPRPNWVFPLLFSVLLSFLVAAAVITRPEWQDTLQKALEGSGQSLGELERRDLLSAMRVVSWIGFLAAPVVSNLFLAALFWGIAVRLGGKSGFLPVFSYQLHAQMVKVLPETIVLAWMLARGGGVLGSQTPLPLNLAFFLPFEGMAPALKSIAESVELFGIWYWAVMVAGLAIVTEVPWRRLLVPCTFLWGLGVLIKAMLRVLSAGPAG